MDLRQIAGSVAAGFLLWSGFAPLEFWIGPILGAILLYGLLQENRLSRRWLISFVTAVNFFAPLLHWSSTYVGAFPWLILVLGQALLFSPLALFQSKDGWISVFRFATLFMVLEIVRMKLPFGGFGWGKIGFTQVDSLPWLYPLIGVTGISFLVAFFAASVKMKPLFLLILLFPLLLSALPEEERLVNQKQFKIVAIQGGVDSLGFDFNDTPLRVLDRHIEATTDHYEKTSDEVQLYLWPENSVDLDPRVNSESQKRLMEIANKVSTPILTGTVEKSSKGPKNSAVLYDEKGQVLSRYVKQDLAPFGEYIPMRKLAEMISPYAVQVNDFVPGNSWQKFAMDEFSFQTLICFEVLDDDHVRAGARNTDFLVAQTNNATFGASQQAAQQLQITRARAAELSKEFAVVSTTGFTAHIDKKGQIIDQLTQFESGALEMGMQSSTARTLASRLGSEFWLIFGALSWIVTLRRSRRFNR